MQVEGSAEAANSKMHLGVEDGQGGKRKSEGCGQLWEQGAELCGWQGARSVSSSAHALSWALMGGAVHAASDRRRGRGCGTRTDRARGHDHGQ